MRQLLRSDGWLAACLAALLVVTFVGCEGCTTSQKATAYKSLAIVASSVDAGMRAFADAVVQGKVPSETQAKVRDLHGRYQKALQAAILVAHFDTGKAAPADVTALATELLTLITAVTKGSA